MDEKQTVDGRDTVIEATRKYSRRVCVRPDSRGRHLMDQSTHNWDIAICNMALRQSQTKRAERPVCIHWGITESRELWSGGHQLLALFIVCVLCEVFDETRCQIQRLDLPFGIAGVGIPRIQNV